MLEIILTGMLLSLEELYYDLLSGITITNLQQYIILMRLEPYRNGWSVMMWSWI